MSGVSQTGRRKFELSKEDEIEWKKRQEARKKSREEGQDINVKKHKKDLIEGVDYLAYEERSFIEARKKAIDLDFNVGKTQIISNSDELEKSAYYCSVCECSLNSSRSYINHLNGKSHNRLLGLKLEVKRANINQVKDKLKSLKRKKPEKESDKNKSSLSSAEAMKLAIKQRLKKAEIVAAESKAAKIASKANNKKQKTSHITTSNNNEKSIVEEEDNEIAKLMGFSGFGGK